MQLESWWVKTFRHPWWCPKYAETCRMDKKITVDFNTPKLYLMAYNPPFMKLEDWLVDSYVVWRRYINSRGYFVSNDRMVPSSNRKRRGRCCRSIWRYYKDTCLEILRSALSTAETRNSNRQKTSQIYYRFSYLLCVSEIFILIGPRASVWLECTDSKKKVNVSRYTPWRRLGGKEV
jgi:hypothetical protein